MPTAQGNYTQLSASGLVATGRARLFGIFCSASTAGTAKVWDNTAASGPVVADTFPLVAGQYYPLPAQLAAGCFVTIAGTSASISVFAAQGS